jgi:transketolase
MNYYNKAKELRIKILTTALKAGKGHVPPAFSWLEIAVSLFYGKILKSNPKAKKNNFRDRFLLSKGHGCLTLYTILADLKFFSKKELDNFAGDGSLLAGHPDERIPGVEIASGSLGHGLGVGCGMALSAKKNKESWNTFVVMGDGECQEGSIWEALMFASKHKLDNLIGIIDRNKLGSTEFTENNAPLEPFKKKFINFGCEVHEVDGHDIFGLIKLFKKLRIKKNKKPKIVICNTIKGKGVSFMENSKLWHHQLPNKDQTIKAFKELK